MLKAWAAASTCTAQHYLSMLRQGMYQISTSTHLLASCTLYICSLNATFTRVAGELEAETAALLAMEKVSDVEFTPEVLACLPKEHEEWSISSEERAQRTDFTGIRYAEALMHRVWESF